MHIMKVPCGQPRTKVWKSIKLWVYQYLFTSKHHTINKTIVVFDRPSPLLWHPIVPACLLLEILTSKDHPHLHLYLHLDHPKATLRYIHTYYINICSLQNITWQIKPLCNLTGPSHCYDTWSPQYISHWRFLLRRTIHAYTHSFTWTIPKPHSGSYVM
jgi:hypothetical protein